jgi:hypothetical protein
VLTEPLETVLRPLLAVVVALAVQTEPTHVLGLAHLLECPVALLVAVREVRQAVVMEPEQVAQSA